jgi:hypothetical protein
MKNSLDKDVHLFHLAFWGFIERVVKPWKLFVLILNIHSIFPQLLQNFYNSTRLRNRDYSIAVAMSYVCGGHRWQFVFPRKPFQESNNREGSNRNIGSGKEEFLQKSPYK